ncbi:MAG: hypothetical protein K0U45_05015 [Alphaproteobacteria bacterium]|nr:hypothetical protein [Alphaproteobacteria bacterium]
MVSKMFEYLQKIKYIFFAPHRNFWQKLSLIALAVFMFSHSLMSWHNREYFDIFSEQMSIGNVWLYANDLSPNYTPFTSKIASVDIHKNIVDVDLDKFDVAQLGDNFVINGITTGYRLTDHIFAVLFKIAGIKKLKTIQNTLYLMAILFSCGLFLLWVRHGLHRTGNYLPLLLLFYVWPFFETDVNLWWNVGRHLLPILLFAFYIQKWLAVCDYGISGRRIYHEYIKLALIVITLVTFMALNTYAYIPVDLGTLLAFYGYYCYEQKVKLSATRALWLRQWFVGSVVIGIAMIVGLLLALLLHYQLVPNATVFRGISDRAVGSQASHGIPSALEILDLTKGYIALLIIIPLIMAMVKMKGDVKYVVCIILLLPALGMLAWHIALPYYSNHVFQFRQTFGYSLLPIVLLLFSRDDMQFKLPKILKIWRQ